MKRSSKPVSGDKTDTTVPYHRKPVDMGIEDWQKALRRQYVLDKSFDIVKLGPHAVFCDYLVRNPESGNRYKVSIRDRAGERNFCECLDFKTNGLGTCKHIEAVIRAIEGKRSLKKVFREGYTPPYSSVYLAYGSDRQVKLRIGSDKTKEFTALASAYFDGEWTLVPFAYRRFDSFLKEAAAIDEGFRCYKDALAFVLDARDRERRIARIDKTYAGTDSLNGFLKTELYEYQRSGIFFAVKAGRSMIADEMGLGKTVQAIGAALLFKREAGVRRVLIVCPTSLKYQWQSEIARFCDEQVLVVEGGPLVRARSYREEAFFTIVSYHTVGADLEAIEEMEPDLVILDEAQRIKNWKTKLARTVKKIRSTYAIVLTGTPLENNIEELYSIVQFLDPFRLGPYYAFLSEHQTKDDRGKVIGYRNLHEIGDALSGLVIRRRKREVLDQLPERIDELKLVPMTDRQRVIHEEYVDAVARLVFRWRKLGFLSEKDRQRLLINLNMMRMICDSTYILDQDAENRHDTKVGELFCLLDEALEDPETKVVVFSQWERMTRIVARELETRGIGFEHLHGGVPSVDRKALYDRFNGDMFCRVFLSTDAGSVGLNLQSASVLVNLDLPWNPAVLEQRIARIHRIGQRRSVHIVNFVSADSIESRMLTVLGFKSDLARGILDGGEDSIFMADEKYGRFMDAVEKLAVPLAPCAPVEESDGAEEAESDEFAGIGGSDEPEEEDPTMPGMSEHEALAARGLSFLGDLARILSSPESTERFVSGLVKKDESTGTTYLKIPVENEKLAVDALTALGQLFATLGAGK